jgi:hypothetical protein
MMKFLKTDSIWRVDLRRSRRTVATVLLTGATGLALAVPAAQAGTANAGLRGAASNPLAHMKWGVPHDDNLWTSYESMKGSNQTILGRLALQPVATWLGWENPVREVRAQTAAMVAAAQNGNPNALTELATFELHPWEAPKSTGQDTPTVRGSWNVKSDETWYRNMAAGIGNARALVIVQVDLPVARRIISSQPGQIDTYAARVLSANRHTTVYIDGGTVGWGTPTQDAALLIQNGIRYARGFALDDTDYDPTAKEDVFGAQVIAALAKRGVKGKHFIVNTDENGQPYKPYQVPGRAINDTPMCHGHIQTVCQRLGIPPTTNVASSRWHLGATASTDARRYCDAYIWAGQPWEIDNGPYVQQYALWLAENGEY